MRQWPVMGVSQEIIDMIPSHYWKQYIVLWFQKRLGNALGSWYVNTGSNIQRCKKHKSVIFKSKLCDFTQMLLKYRQDYKVTQVRVNIDNSRIYSFWKLFSKGNIILQLNLFSIRILFLLSLHEICDKEPLLRQRACCWDILPLLNSLVENCVQRLPCHHLGF